nr:mechanosensitive ion channel family protein [Nakamurella sp. PAMC28650]
MTVLNDMGTWARGNGLQIVLLVLGSILLGRMVRWTSTRITERIDARSDGDDALVKSEAAKHRHVLAQVISWTVLVVVYAIAGVLVIELLGVPLAGFVAPATVIGVALGFGAQRVVQDLLTGFFVIAERQYGFGDLIRMSVIGVPVPVLGTVEDVTLRVTTVRSTNGEVVITPNGQIVQVTNLSRDWARAVIDVPVPATADVTKVSELLRQVGLAAFADRELQPLLLDAPTVMGVESLEVDQFKIRLVARTLPGKQFEVGRALRMRITGTLSQAGINLPAALDTSALDTSAPDAVALDAATPVTTS